jgi:hypothetical protein
MTIELRPVDDAADRNAVTAWFGSAFGLLHPLLQALHRDGGRLTGSANLQFGKGITGMLGRHLARKLGIPDVAGSHRLDVDIRHDATALYWNRQFDHAHAVRSVFRPVGHWPDGHWVENTGPLELGLRVEIEQGGWYWRAVHVRVRGVCVPLWLMPRSTAFKRIEEGRYRFHVAFSMPILGEVLSYSGLLEPDAESTHHKVACFGLK